MNGRRCVVARLAAGTFDAGERRPDVVGQSFFAEVGDGDVRAHRQQLTQLGHAVGPYLDAVGVGLPQMEQTNQQEGHRLVGVEQLGVQGLLPKVFRVAQVGVDDRVPPAIPFTVKEKLGVCDGDWVVVDEDDAGSGPFVVSDGVRRGRARHTGADVEKLTNPLPHQVTNNPVEEKSVRESDSPHQGKLVKKLISVGAVDFPVGHTTQKVVIDTRQAGGIQMHGDGG